MAAPAGACAAAFFHIPSTFYFRDVAGMRPSTSFHHKHYPRLTICQLPQLLVTPCHLFHGERDTNAHATMCILLLLLRLLPLLTLLPSYARSPPPLSPFTASTCRPSAPTTPSSSSSSTGAPPSLFPSSTHHRPARPKASCSLPCITMFPCSSHLRVVIHTANLIPVDWQHKSQGVW